MIAALRASLAEAFGALADAFRTPDLRRLQLAYAVSLIGLWAYGVAVTVFAYRAGGAALVGVAAVIRLVPAAVAAPFAALLADRFSRRLVLLATDAIRAGVIAASAVAVVLGLPAAVVLVLAGVLVVVSTAFEPAKNAILPSLVREPKQLTAANVANSSFESASIFLGPALGGLALAAWSIEAAFAVTAGLLLLSVVLIARIDEPSRGAGQNGRGEVETSAQSEGLAGQVLAGVRAIAASPPMRVIVGATSAQLVVDGALGVLTVVMAVELLEMGEPGVGYLSSAVGIGGLLGAVAALAVAGRGLGRVFTFGIAFWGAPLLLVPLLPEPAVVLVLFGLIGVANTVVDSAWQTLLQRAAPEHLRARVFGALESLIIAAVGLGSLLASALVETVGVKAALVVFGIFLPLVALVSGRRLSRLDAELARPERELELLRGVPIFAPLEAARVERLAGELASVSVAAGEEVIRQGEVGDRFYVIAGGEVEVLEDGVLARRQGEGEYFGEIALLRDVPRTATVVARSDLELLALEREDFIAAVTGHARSAEAADAVIAGRLGSVRAGAGVA